MGGNNSNKITIIETVLRISRFEEENYISRMNSSKYSNVVEDYPLSKNNSVQMSEKKMTTPRKQTINQNLSIQIQEPNVSPIKKVKEESTLAASDSFDDLFNQAMSNKSENPFLTQQELQEIEEGMKKSSKPSYYYEDEEEEDPINPNEKEEPIKPKEPEPQISSNQSNEISSKNEKIDETPIENATQDLSESYSSYIDSQIKNLSVTPFSKEKDEMEEEPEEFDQESLKRLQESADPKLKNSKLFDFFSKFSNSETEKSSSSTFDEIYSNVEKVEKKDETTEEIEPVAVVDLEQKKKEIFEKFESYDFLNDQKYQELLEFSIKKGTFDNMDEETVEKAKSKLQGKYFSKNIDQSNLFSHDEYLERSKKEKENVETMETPYSQDFVNIVTKLQNGEEFQDVKIIDDKPKSSTPKLTESKLKKKVKPWEKKKEIQ
jgi:hypothetical protein